AGRLRRGQHLLAQYRRPARAAGGAGAAPPGGRAARGAGAPGVAPWPPRAAAGQGRARPQRRGHRRRRARAWRPGGGRRDRDQHHGLAHRRAGTSARAPDRRPLGRAADEQVHRGAAHAAHPPARRRPAGRRGRHPVGGRRRQEDRRRRLAGAALHRPGLSRPRPGRRMRRGHPPAQGSPEPRQPSEPVNDSAIDADPTVRWTRDADLRARTSLRVPARAAWLAEVRDAAALPAVLDDPRIAGGELLMLGGGSNLLFAADLAGVALAIRDEAIAVVDDDGEAVRVRAGAGRGWHDFVLQTLSLGLSGLENLSLIPGTVGAAPIQNIGAYGVELDQRVHAVEAWDREAGAPVRLAAADCGFAYRDSRFKREPGR